MEYCGFIAVKCDMFLSAVFLLVQIWRTQHLLETAGDFQHQHFLTNNRILYCFAVLSTPHQFTVLSADCYFVHTDAPTS